MARQEDCHVEALVASVAGPCVVAAETEADAAFLQVRKDLGHILFPLLSLEGHLHLEEALEEEVLVACEEEVVVAEEILFLGMIGEVEAAWE